MVRPLGDHAVDAHAAGIRGGCPARVHRHALQPHVGAARGVEVGRPGVAEAPARRGPERVDGADERGDELGGRAVVDVLRGADLLDPPRVEDGDAVAHGERLLLVVRDVHGRDAQTRLQALQLVAQLHAELRVEVGQRLVEQEDPRLEHERPRDGDALLLAAGELGHVLVELRLAQLDLVGHRTHEPVGLGLARLPDREAERDVLPHRHAGEERVVLEDHAHAALLARQPRGDLAVDDDVAAARVDEAGERPQRRRLAAAGRPEEREELALVDLEVEPRDRHLVAEAHLDVVEADHQGWYSSSVFSTQSAMCSRTKP